MASRNGHRRDRRQKIFLPFDQFFHLLLQLIHFVWIEESGCLAAYCRGMGIGKVCGQYRFAGHRKFRYRQAPCFAFGWKYQTVDLRIKIEQPFARLKSCKLYGRNISVFPPQPRCILIFVPRQSNINLKIFYSLFFFRYSPGVIPYVFLKVRMKCSGLSYPTSSQIARLLREVSRRA